MVTEQAPVRIRRRPVEIMFRGIVTEPSDDFMTIAYPSRAKGSSPFIGLTFGVNKNLRDSFEFGEFDLPFNHSFKEWDRVSITIRTLGDKMFNKSVDGEVIYPVAITDFGERWISGIFPLSNKESSHEDFTYDLPIAHPFKSYDELIVIIKRVGGGTPNERQ